MKKFALVLIVAACSAIVACAADDASNGEGENIGESEGKLLAGRQVSESETATVLRQAGFPESSIGQMVCTAKYESTFYEEASHKNKNGTTDYGLLQINSVHLGERGCPSKADGLYDAAANAQCGYAIYKSQGNNAWYGYRSHRSECDSYPAPPIRAASPAGPAAGTSASAPSSGADAGADGGRIPGSCTHDVCTAGDKLGQACDSCTMKVCAADPYCCDTFWGLSCFDSVAKYCGKTCN